MLQCLHVVVVVAVILVPWLVLVVFGFAIATSIVAAARFWGGGLVVKLPVWLVSCLFLLSGCC